MRSSVYCPNSMKSQNLFLDELAKKNIKLFVLVFVALLDKIVLEQLWSMF